MQVVRRIAAQLDASRLPPRPAAAAGLLDILHGPDYMDAVLPLQVQYLHDKTHAPSSNILPNDPAADFAAVGTFSLDSNLESLLSWEFLQNAPI